MAMAVDEDAEQEVAPRNKKSPTEDEKRYIYMNRVQCDVTLLRYFSLMYFDKSSACQISRWSEISNLSHYKMFKFLSFLNSKIIIHKTWVCGMNKNCIWLTKNLSYILRATKLCNPTVGFSKY